MNRIEGGLKNMALLIATALVVVLAIQMRAKNRGLGVLHARANSLLPGSFTPLLTVTDIDGDTVQLGRTNAHGLVYLVYNTRCPYCERSLSAWRSLSAKFDDNSGIIVLGISLDSTKLTLQYNTLHSLEFECVSLVDRRTQDIHRFGVVPQTIVMDPDGRVILSRLGVLEFGPALDSVFGAIETLLGEDRQAPVGTRESTGEGDGAG